MFPPLACLNPVLSHPLAAIPLNKQLYTFSYICVTAGAAGIVFSMLYFLVSPFFNFYKPFLEFLCEKQ